jgi:hypothetical protein
MGKTAHAIERSTHLDLPDGEIKESHVVSDLDDGLWTDTTHRGTETTVELENGKLVEDRRVDIGEDLVSTDLLRLGGLNSLPVAMGSARSLGRMQQVYAYIFSPLARSVRNRLKRRKKDCISASKI